MVLNMEVPVATYSRYRFVIALIITWLFFIAGCSFQVMPPILPLISKDLGISNGESGLLIGSFLLMTAVFSIPSGFVIRWLGLKNTFTVVAILIGTLSLAYFKTNFETLLTLRILSGLGVAILTPSTGPLLVGWFKPSEVSLMSGVIFSSFAAGMVISMTTASVGTELLGWPGLISLYGILGLIGALLWILVGKNPGYSEDNEVSNLLSEMRTVMRSRVLFLLVFIDVVVFPQFIVLTGWLPSFYTEFHGITLAKASFLVSFIALSGIPGTLISGILSSKTGPRREYLIIAGVLTGLGGLGSFLTTNVPIKYISLFSLGFGSSFYFPIILAWCTQLPGISRTGVALAWGWIMCFSALSAFIAPPLVGLVKDTTGSFVTGFLVVNLLSWSIIFIALKIPKNSFAAIKVQGMQTHTKHY